MKLPLIVLINFVFLAPLVRADPPPTTQGPIVPSDQDPHVKFAEMEGTVGSVDNVKNRLGVVSQEGPRDFSLNTNLPVYKDNVAVPMSDLKPGSAVRVIYQENTGEPTRIEFLDKSLGGK